MKHINDTVDYDRIIVVTDEQASGSLMITGGEGDPVKSLPDPKADGYMINVASAKNGDYHKRVFGHYDPAVLVQAPSLLPKWRLLAKRWR